MEAGGKEVVLLDTDPAMLITARKPSFLVNTL